MAIRFQYVEKGVVHVQWIEKVTIEEIEIGMRQIRDIIDQEGDPEYVEIIDLQACTVIPFDLRGLWRVGTYDPRTVGYVVVKANSLAQTMVKMLSQVAGLSFRMTSSLDEALTAARLMLQEHSPTKA